MVLILAIAQLVLISLITYREADRKSPVVYLWATLLVMFGITHLITCATGKSAFSNETLSQASLFASLFCLLYLVARESTLRLIKRANLKSTISSVVENDHVEPMHGFVCALVVVVFYLIWHAAVLSGGLMDVSWGGLRAAGENASYFNVSQFATILFFSFGGVLCYALIKKKWILAFGVGIAHITTIVILRNRVFVLPLLVSFISVFLLRMKRIRLRSVLLAVLAAVVVIYIVYGIRAFRWYGTLDNFLNTFNFDDFNAQILLFLESENGELGLKNAFYYFLANNNDFPGFGQGATYIRMLLVYVPTQLSFGLKPLDFAQTMGAAYGLAPGGSYHPTLFGDAYANFAWPGILIGVFWGAYSSIGDFLITRFKSGLISILAFCLLASSYVIIARGAVYNAFLWVAWGLPVLAVIAFFTPKLAANISAQLQPNSNRMRGSAGGDSK